MRRRPQPHHLRPQRNRPVIPISRPMMQPNTYRHPSNRLTKNTPHNHHHTNPTPTQATSILPEPSPTEPCEARAACEAGPQPNHQQLPVNHPKNHLKAINYEPHVPQAWGPALTQRPSNPSASTYKCARDEEDYTPAAVSDNKGFKPPSYTTDGLLTVNHVTRNSLPEHQRSDQRGWRRFWRCRGWV